jgi:YD repeat-containing protein
MKSFTLFATNRFYMVPLAFFLFVSVKICAQGDVHYVTPQTADFMKYGNIPVSLYTGRLNFSIPIYRIQDPDFDVPLSLEYSSEGFQPQKHSGLVGLNWFLNIGGCVTRTVYGTPDDFLKNDDYDLCWYPNGFLIQSRIKIYNKDLVYHFSSSIGTTNSSGAFVFSDLGENYDYKPDIFSFNVNGHSGSFFVGNDGSVKLLSNEYFKVDLSGITGEQPRMKKNAAPNGSSEIRLKDLNGYTYYFGGSIYAEEFSIQVDCGDSGESADNSGFLQKTPCIMAWYLTKIVAPNGRSINFHYTENQWATTYHTKTDPLWMFKEFYSQGVHYSQNASGTAATSGTETLVKRKAASKSVVLRNITIDDIGFSMSFNKTIEEYPLYYSGGDFCNKNYQLNSVVSSINGVTLDSTSFAYSYAMGSNNLWGRRFLSSITNFANGMYNFTYDNTYTYPDAKLLLKSEVDDYGYWKKSSLQGLLKTVTYPTGGKSMFTYESHNYSKMRYYELGLSGISVIHALKSVAVNKLGGARICEVRDYQKDGSLSDITKYNYTTKIDYEGSLNTSSTSTDSSGLIIDFDTTRTAISSSALLTLDRTSAAISLDSIKSTGIFHTQWISLFNEFHTSFEGDEYFGIAEPSVGYSQVTEIHKDANGGVANYTVNKFSDYKGNSDNSTYLFNHAVTSYSNLVSMKFLFYNSVSYRRGHLLSQDEYSSSLQLKKRTRYTLNAVGAPDVLSLDYGNQLSVDTNYIVVLEQENDITMARKIPYAPDYINSKSEVEYQNGIALPEKAVNYFHDDLFRITEEQNMGSDGRTYFKRYRFADEIVGDLSTGSDSLISGYALMVSANRLSMPMETVSGYMLSGIRYDVGGTLWLYKPSTISYVSGLSAPFQKYNLNISAPVSDYDSVRVLNGTIHYDARMAQEEEYVYDSNLRLTKYTPYGQLAKSYVWGYSNLYPITETKDSYVTTYTYKPLVGMLTSTDPRGLTTYYEYDSYNRLVCIKDCDGKIIKKYDYNYAK